MQHGTTRRTLLGAATLAAGLQAPALRAQETWPSRPIRMIVPYTPGGAVDAMARLAAQKLTEGLGVTVVVENRAGANGAIGGQAMLQAPADGYTILASASIHPMAKYVMKSAPYDAVKDFTPVARTARGPLLLVISPKLPQQTIPEVVAAAKANPDKWSFATSSLGSAGHLGSIEFNRLTRSQIEIVGYRGSAPALTDIAAGNVQLMCDPILSTLPLVRGGQIRALAIAADKRSELLPDIPTTAEAGLPGFEFYSWYGIWCANDVPVEIIRRMNAILVNGMKDPATTARLAGQGFEAVTETAAEAARFIRRDVAHNAELLRLAKFEPE